MKRWHLMLAASLVALATSLFGAQADQRPNIVLLISDDHDFAHLGFMGYPVGHTPQLDQLARAGVLFTHAHLPMSRCHPTLASFLSGRWPHQSGIYYNYGSQKLDPTNSLPNLLKQAGYATYVEGKYWEGDPRAMGFTHGKGKTANTFVRRDQKDLFAFIDQLAGRQPLFIWWAPKIPHTPHNPPAKYRQLVADKEIPLPSWIPADRRGEFFDKERLSLAMEAWLDDGVGQLVDKLKQAGIYDNTLFVFVIDNGWCNGLVSKGSPFEKGVRTPVFFTWSKGIRGGRQFSTLISTLDIYPTILDFAGVPVPETAAGRSLRPIIEGRATEHRDRLFGAIYPAFATKGDERPERDVYALYVRDQRWKYILYVQDVVASRNGNYFRIQHILTDFPTRQRGDQDLYDLQNDPAELQDLAELPEHAERVAEMRKAVLQWWRQTGGKPIEGFAP